MDTDIFETDETPVPPAEPIHGVFTDVWTVQPKQINWVIEHLLPPGLTIMGAEPKTGKSTVTMAMAALVSGLKCQALPSHLSRVPVDGVVMAFSYEALAEELRFMLEKGLSVSGSDNESLLIADDPWSFRLDQPGAIDRMLFWLNERKPRLAILDPLRNFHSLEEKDSRIISLLLPLRQWAIKNDSSILVVHHTKKPGGDDSGNRTANANDLRGTSALFGIADGVLMLTRAGATFGRLHVNATFKRAKGWESDIQLAAWGVSEPSHEVLNDQDRLVLSLLKQGPMNAQSINAQLRTGVNGTIEILTRLERNGLIKKEGTTWKLIQK